MGTISCTIQGQAKSVKAGTVNITENLNNRATATFTIEGFSLSNINEGDEVVLTRESDSEIIFAGNVLNSVYSHNHITDLVNIRVNCSSYEFLADRRIVAEVYITESSGDIVTDLMNKYLAADGVTAGQIDAGTSLNRAVFNYKRLSDVFNQLADTNGFVWYIDYNKELFFVEREFQAAPYDIDETDNTKKAIRAVSVNTSLNNYTNKRYIEYNELTSQQTETFVGDGVRNTWNLAYPVAKTPVVYVNNVQKTVGILGLDDDKNFYWSKNTHEITQDSDDPVLMPTTVNFAYPPSRLSILFNQIEHDFAAFTIKDVYAYGDLVIIGRNFNSSADLSGYVVYKFVDGVYKQINNLYLSAVGAERIEKMIGMGAGFIALETTGIDTYRWRYYEIIQDGISFVANIQSTTGSLRKRFRFASGNQIAGNDAQSVFNSTFVVWSIAKDGTVTALTGLNASQDASDYRYFLGFDGGYAITYDTGLTDPAELRQFSIDGNTYTLTTDPPAPTGTIIGDQFAQTQGYFVLKTSAGLELYTRSGFSATLTKSTAVTLPTGYTFKSGSYNIFFVGKILWVAVNESPYFLQFIINANDDLELLETLMTYTHDDVVKFSVFDNKLFLVAETEDLSAVSQIAPEDILQVEYYGSFPNIEIFDSGSEIAQRISVEGGSGIYETFQTIADIEDSDDIYKLGQAIIDKFGKIPKIISFETLQEGLDIGQIITFNWPTLGVNNEQFLVESMAIRDISASVIWYSYRIISGINANTWQDFWREITQSQVTRLNTSDIVTKAESISEIIEINDILETQTAAVGTDWDESNWDTFEWQA